MGSASNQRILLRLPEARDDAKAARHVPVHAHHVVTVLQAFGIPEERQIVDDGKTLGERHVVGQPRARQRYRHQVLQLVVGADHAVVHVGRFLGVVEEQQLAAVLIELGVRRNATLGHPLFGTELLQGAGIQAIALAALIERRKGHAGVHDDVGRRRVLQSSLRTPSRPLRPRRRLHQPRPERAPRLLLRMETRRAHEAVTVLRAALGKAHDVQHAVAVEGMVAADGCMYRVLGVTQVHPVDVPRNPADHRHVGGVVLVVVRRPGAVEVGVIARFEGGFDSVYQGGRHVTCSCARRSWGIPVVPVPQAPSMPAGVFSSLVGVPTSPPDRSARDTLTPLPTPR